MAPMGPHVTTNGIWVLLVYCFHHSSPPKKPQFLWNTFDWSLEHKLIIIICVLFFCFQMLCFQAFEANKLLGIILYIIFKAHSCYLLTSVWKRGIIVTPLMLLSWQMCLWSSFTWISAWSHQYLQLMWSMSITPNIKEELINS